jgi:hypothetical protein
VQGYDPRFQPSTFAQLPIWLVIQAMRAKKADLNQLALPTAQNTLMLYQINADTSKVSEADQLTVASFMPYPDIWDDNAVEITIAMSPRTAKRFLNAYNGSKAYVKFAVTDIYKQIVVLAKR